MRAVPCSGWHGQAKGIRRTPTGASGADGSSALAFPRKISAQKYRQNISAKKFRAENRGLMQISLWDEIPDMPEDGLADADYFRLSAIAALLAIRSRELGYADTLGAF